MEVILGQKINWGILNGTRKKVDSNISVQFTLKNFLSDKDKLDSHKQKNLFLQHIDSNSDSLFVIFPKSLNPPQQPHHALSVKKLCLRRNKPRKRFSHKPRKSWYKNTETQKSLIFELDTITGMWDFGLEVSVPAFCHKFKQNKKQLKNLSWHIFSHWIGELWNLESCWSKKRKQRKLRFRRQTFKVEEESEG